ncbi:antA/AntB antirepressor family protein [Fusobacterium mortiferum]|uniref:AntA/AntB antirepressor family protein n=1 Tax=Fusobacterium mortiferum TaxID=850 RepID=A0ABS2G4U6_FUSMR|nr:antA/AntB antirepressor family protein [Fusobacterium mortiferum]MBM6875778.1 antA/AntB antirepressor family protein [Fusobacterium mortiferum]
MRELITIKQNETGEQLVSARELHKKLEISERFNNWFERMLKYGFIENIDYTGCKIFNTQANQELDEYILKLDMAKQICMLQRSELGTQFRIYFIECEKRLKEVAQPKLPKTYLEALKELVKIEEEKIALEYRVNNLVHSKKLYTTTEIAKELGFKSANALNNILEEDKIQYKVNGTWVLCSKYSDKDYVSIKQTELDNGKIIYDRKWTGIGRDFLVSKYGLINTYPEEVLDEIFM